MHVNIYFILRVHICFSLVILVQIQTIVQIQTFKACTYTVWTILFYVYRSTRSTLRIDVFLRYGRIRDVRQCLVRTSSTRMSGRILFSATGCHGNH